VLFRSVIAGAIGVPVSTLEGKRFRWTNLEQPPRVQTFSTDEIRGAAVINRLDVQRSLSEYEAAQSNLQLEIAKQYPDLDIGPGYNFEEAQHFFSIAATVVLPIRNRNEGPIAEAQAKRRVAGATLLNTQALVIAQSDKALAQYRAAQATLDDAGRSLELQMEQERQQRKAFDAGEVDRLVLVGAQLQTAITARARADAARQAQVALGALEDALQRPLETGVAPVLPQRPPR
jgi:outer membrane protein TolC